MLEPPWAILGLSWGHPGPAGGYFTSTLPPSDLSRDCKKNLCYVDAKRLFLESSYRGFVQSYVWRILGAILGYLGAILKPPWNHLGRYWAHLGPILGLPGAILAEFMQNLLGQILCNAKFATANFESKFCVTQNLPRQLLCKAKLARASFRYGPSWSTLGPSWGHCGAILGPSWGILEPPWAILGPSWGHLGAMLGLPGATLPRLYCPPIAITI